MKNPNNTQRLETVLDSLIEMKSVGLDMSGILDNMKSYRDKIAEVLEDPHGDDDPVTTEKLRTGLNNLNASIAALESAKVQ